MWSFHDVIMSISGFFKIGKEAHKDKEIAVSALKITHELNKGPSIFNSITAGELFKLLRKNACWIYIPIFCFNIPLIRDLRIFFRTFFLASRNFAQKFRRDWTTENLRLLDFALFYTLSGSTVDIIYKKNCWIWILLRIARRW